LPDNAEPVAVTIGSLRDNSRFVSHSAKLVREQTTHRFNSADARGEGV
jgi:hypothetical protein